MKKALRLGWITFGVALTVWVGAQSASRGPEVDAHGPSQAAADVLRDAASADGAFLPAGLVKNTVTPDNLASLLQFPSDDVVVVALRGAQVRQALERSVALYPQPNASFLQLSGFEVSFDPNGAPGSRIRRVTAGGGALDDNREYRVAMPGSLGRGGLGYFKIWDRSKIVQTLPDSLETVLQGKRVTDSRPRWSVQ